MTEKMKPPPRRRTSGRVLGGGTQGGSTPPPSAELTREQLDAEQAKEINESEPSPAPAPAPAPAPQQAVQTHTPQTAEAVGATAAASDTSPTPAPAAVPNPSASTPLGIQQTPHTLAGTPAPSTSGPAYEGPPAELAVRPAQLSAPSNGPFPTATGQSDQPHQQADSSDEALSNGSSWTQGPGRPKTIPTAAEVLNRRIITRESLDASVAADLRIKKRLKRFALDNEVDHLPMGDIVTVALDEWLSTRGY